jgi:16S rRNA (guanine527-N7)-methyltransferase
MLTQAQTLLLTEGAKRLGLDLADEEIACFSTYLEELLRWSKVADLVSQTDSESIIRKHLLDCLAVSPLIPFDVRLLDLGSGAGFPGLVLAIVGPARKVVLVEARRKRVNFLKEVVRKTKLVNVRVYEGRAEALAAEEALHTSFQIVVTRATWSLGKFLRLASPFIAPDGIALAMKGPQVEKELLSLDQDLRTFGFCLDRRRYVYTLPFAGEHREAVVFKNFSFT